MISWLYSFVLSIVDPEPSWLNESSDDPNADAQRHVDWHDAHQGRRCYARALHSFDLSLAMWHQIRELDRAISEARRRSPVASGATEGIGL